LLSNKNSCSLNIFEPIVSNNCCGEGDKEENEAIRVFSIEISNGLKVGLEGKMSDNMKGIALFLTCPYLEKKNSIKPILKIK
jgi:hypothetical protein